MFLGRDLFEERNYSEQTAVLIDEEVRRLVDDCYTQARQTLLEHRAQLDLLATRLLEKEVLDGDEVKQLVGPLTAAFGATNHSSGNSHSQSAT